jgi:hypothetical protein
MGGGGTGFEVTQGGQLDWGGFGNGLRVVRRSGQGASVAAD